jgi:Alcohol dehydrogenase GroES-like domain
MYKTKASSAASATSPLASTTIPRRDPTEHDVQIEILLCGICHSDLHSVRKEWSEFMPRHSEDSARRDRRLCWLKASRLGACPSKPQVRGFEWNRTGT